MMNNLNSLTENQVATIQPVKETQIPEEALTIVYDFIQGIRVLDEEKAAIIYKLEDVAEVKRLVINNINVK